MKLTKKFETVQLQKLVIEEVEKQVGISVELTPEEAGYLAGALGRTRGESSRFLDTSRLYSKLRDELKEYGLSFGGMEPQHPAISAGSEWMNRMRS